MPKTSCTAAGFVDEARRWLADSRFSEFGGIAGAFGPDPGHVDSGIVGCVTSLTNRVSQLRELLLGRSRSVTVDSTTARIVRALAGAA